MGQGFGLPSRCRRLGDDTIAFLDRGAPFGLPPEDHGSNRRAGE